MTEQQDAASEDSILLYIDITISMAMELSVVNPGVEGAKTVPLALQQTTGCWQQHLGCKDAGRSSGRVLHHHHHRRSNPGW
jgi:hypothetical protein